MQCYVNVQFSVQYVNLTRLKVIFLVSKTFYQKNTKYIDKFSHPTFLFICKIDNFRKHNISICSNYFYFWPLPLYQHLELLKLASVQLCNYFMTLTIHLPRILLSINTITFGRGLQIESTLPIFDYYQYINNVPVTTISSNSEFKVLCCLHCLHSGKQFQVFKQAGRKINRCRNN